MHYPESGVSEVGGSSEHSGGNGWCDEGDME